MTNELELKLQECEVAIRFFRQQRLNSQSLRGILIDLYNLLENKEAEKKPSYAKKKVEEIKEKPAE